jgi:RNA polymerase sigma-70 factor (ECF subfamily)
LASLNHFAANRWRDAHALKRGGAASALSLDFTTAESRYLGEPSHEMTPERVFERRWAMTLLHNAMAKLSDEYARAGKLSLLEHLKDHLGGDPHATPYKQLAEELQMSEGAIKVAAHRLRKRCRQLLRAEIAETVSSPDEIDLELRHLFVALEP